MRLRALGPRKRGTSVGPVGYDRGMYLVAVATLATSLEEEAPKLGADLGMTGYEARMLLAGVLPAIVLRARDKEQATELLARLRGRRHDAVACDADAVVTQERMTTLGSFALGESALVRHAWRGEPAAELPYDDILAVLRATRNTRTRSVEKIEERKLRIGTALATGGLVMTKKTTREVVHTRDEREQLLYLFRRSGMTPWLLEEHGAQYPRLEGERALSQMENFMRTARELQRRAPDAAYDERLLRLRLSQGDKLASRALDENAHVLALWIARQGRGPYR